MRKKIFKFGVQFRARDFLQKKISDLIEKSHIEMIEGWVVNYECWKLDTLKNLTNYEEKESSGIFSGCNFDFSTAPSENLTGTYFCLSPF